MLCHVCLGSFLCILYVIVAIMYTPSLPSLFHTQRAASAHFVPMMHTTIGRRSFRLPTQVRAHSLHDVEVVASVGKTGTMQRLRANQIQVWLAPKKKPCACAKKTRSRRCRTSSFIGASVCQVLYADRGLLCTCFIFPRFFVVSCQSYAWSEVDEK